MTGYGVFVRDGEARIGYRRGTGVVDLTAAERTGVLDADGAFQTATLNAFLALGPARWRAVNTLAGRLEPTVAVTEVSLLLPFAVADYVDFYSSEQHAANVGRILRPGQPAVPEHWRHLPIGYHGRAGTVVVSGTEVARPCGQRGVGDFGPSTRLDIEAEVGFVVGVPSRPGRPVRTADLAAHVFGVVLVNDWSARDLQAWEYRPLGPFLSKSFATSVSPWVVPLDALARVPAPEQDPPVLPYLREPDRHTFDISLAVTWNGQTVSRPPFRQLYWTPAQQLAHLTVAGAPVRTGDLYASGTVSGSRPDQVGSLLELTGNGAWPVRLPEGTRAFLADGDTVTISGTATGVDGGAVDLGAVSGRIRPPLAG
jgi:fumarylacetoacetase